MITRIGLVAGEIWEYLDDHKGSAGMDEIIKNLEKDRDMVLMCVGWLAREGHIVLEGSSPDYIIKLNK